MNKQHSTYQHLHQFLDQQLHQVQERESSRPSFDNIELKLKNIESKLKSLKVESNDNGTVSYCQQTSSSKLLGSNINKNAGYSSSKKISNHQLGIDSARNPFEPISPVKKHRTQKKTKQYQCDVQTPAKKMGVTSKSKSAVTLLVPSNYNSAKKEKRGITTAKKKQLRSVHIDHCMSSNEKYQKFIPQKTIKTLHGRSSASSIQIRALKRQLQQSEKSNAELRRKVLDLHSYQAECWKLKGIFDRCQQLRRKTRLNNRSKK